MAELAIAAVVGVATAVGSYFLLGSRGLQSQGREGPRLQSSTLTTSTEGEGITRLFGRQRLDGQIIWATQFNENINTTTTKVKTGGKGGGSQRVTDTTYTYSISLAIAFCLGNDKADVSRMWADGKELDLSEINYRFYPGSDTQDADPKIVAVQGVDNTPAYRGTCYIVFEDLELARFGNRVPQITAEIVVPIDTDDPVDIQNSGQAFTLIPASGESVYNTEPVNLITGGEEGNQTTRIDNVHNAFRVPDVNRALENLTRVQNNLDAVLVAVSWFGNDLRAGVCTIRPRIEDNTRNLDPSWSVGTFNRGNTEEVSKDGQGRPIFGGTPSDLGVTQLIQALKAQGKRVIFYPFILMDIPSGNTLPNPYSDNASASGQPAFPWRGRITVSPAAGFAGTADKTSAAISQLNAWFDEYQDMVNHYANLCSAAGGVDGFVIGSELVTITTSRGGASFYPSIPRLQLLASSVKSTLPTTNVGYAADWSEYHSHRPTDGTGDVFFHLDPLWADNNIDFIGVDNYLPISDWRDGTQHLDYDGVNGPVTIFDRDYLMSQVEGGEYFDYFYASQADRESQTRTPITDGQGKPWVFRNKDFRSWWSNNHVNRPAGSESGSNTVWTPGSKPIWFTEFGIPAVNKGTNQPNVFFDPKSSESAFPYFSSGLRDDFIQRVGTETILEYWIANAPTIGGTVMVEPENMFIWTWDARPFPDYPVRLDVWSDGDLWFKGHWWTGRIESVPLARLVAELCELAGLTPAQYDVSGLYGPGALVRGYQIDRPETVRASLETLMQAYLFDGFESEGKIKFLLRSNTLIDAIPGDDYVVTRSNPVGVSLTRGQETELPASVKVTFIDEFNDYNTGSVDGKTSRGYSQNVDEITVPITLTSDYARSLADGYVQQRWVERQRGTIALPPSYVRFDPGDGIQFPVGQNTITGRFTIATIGEQRDMEYVAYDANIFNLPNSPDGERLPSVSNIFGSVRAVFMDLPLFTGEEELPWAPRITANATPWPGAMSLFRQLADDTFEFATEHPFRNAIGRLTAPLQRGLVGRFDRGSVLSVSFDYGALSSVTELRALEQTIALAIFNATIGEWELIQFATATLTGVNSYDVTDLLRGQLGTETVMPDEYPVGATVVLVEPDIVTAVPVTNDLANEEITYSWGPARYPQSDVTYQTGSYTGKRIGLRPYAPTHPRLAGTAAGELTLRWIRRTRFDGDSWNVEEVPLNEEFERYRLRIYNGASLVRTAIVSSPEYVYTVAQQTADFGRAQTSLTIDIAQYGSAFGDYGGVLAATVEITEIAP